MKKPEYVELSFHLPFYEIYFPADNFDESLPKKPTELLELCQEMEIKIDLDFLLLEFETTKTNQGDIYIFYASNKKDSFIYFDFHKGSTDQMAVIQLGVRIKTENKTDIKTILEKLYFKSTTRSNFQEDYFNQLLNSIATNRISTNERTIHSFIDGKK
jgi:hypothetical protein